MHARSSTRGRAQIARVVDAAASARRLIPRRGYEGLDATALQVLLTVYLERSTKGCSVDAIAQRLVLDPSTVSHAVRTLRSERLVRSVVHPSDARRRLSVVTAKGGALAERFAREP
jgi:DNA-binding MarR family transcriptional regulator